MRGATYLGMMVPALLLAATARAEVVSSSAQGFALHFSQTVPADPAAVWAVLIQPARWWSPDHSYSHDAGNFSLDPQAGGCFCETWAGGSVEHARVVFAMPGKALRMLGGFGPLQAAPVSAVLTYRLKPQPDGATSGDRVPGAMIPAATTIEVTYDIAGQMAGGVGGAGLAALAAPVDGVLAEQLRRLAAAIAMVKP